MDIDLKNNESYQQLMKRVKKIQRLQADAEKPGSENFKCKQALSEYIKSLFINDNSESAKISIAEARAWFDKNGLSRLKVYINDQTIEAVISEDQLIKVSKKIIEVEYIVQEKKEKA